jgi:hypothetical protein
MFIGFRSGTEWWRLLCWRTKYLTVSISTVGREIFLQLHTSHFSYNFILPSFPTSYLPLFLQLHTSHFSYNFVLPSFPTTSYFPVFPQLHTSHFSYNFILPSFPTTSYLPLFLQLHTSQLSYNFIFPSFPTTSYFPLFLHLHTSHFSYIFILPTFPSCAGLVSVRPLMKGTRLGRRYLFVLISTSVRSFPWKALSPCSSHTLRTVLSCPLYSGVLSHAGRAWGRTFCEWTLILGQR